MTREDVKDFLRYFKRQHGAHAVVSDFLPNYLVGKVKNLRRLHFQKSSLFGPKMSLRYRVLEVDDDSWKSFERVTFVLSCDKLDLFAELWDAMMSQAKLVSRQSFTFGFFPSKLDDITYVTGNARVGETFTLPCASSVAEMELKLAITQ